jgi:cytochrome c biogenesis protein CcmG/thiol:disulfide interchange protein DsbE
MRRAALVLCLLTPLFAPSRAVAATSIATMPRFELPGRAGSVASDSLRGRIVYVDFWASWCDPCRRSFPWLRTMHERYGDRGLTIVAINLDKDRAAADRFLAKFPAPFLLAFDPQGNTAEAFRVQAMPSSFLIGRDGRVLETLAGFDARRAATIEERIRKECAP